MKKITLYDKDGATTVASKKKAVELIKDGWSETPTQESPGKSTPKTKTRTRRKRTSR